MRILSCESDSWNDHILYLMVLCDAVGGAEDQILESIVKFASASRELQVTGGGCFRNGQEHQQRKCSKCGKEGQYKRDCKKWSPDRHSPGCCKRNRYHLPMDSGHWVKSSPRGESITATKFRGTRRGMSSLCWRRPVSAAAAESQCQSSVWV
ncbi:unnamed protein product [Albugo candida]|uniref:CCHC-type domain-containing protein n=1 Tax=Albugo candida TaxID=65357 RepID=A0A024G891_9STRA|nr:unnamed protein product [Albugo candida]|eukprot:CCI42953.1 unnamed protein product [Albugo candida]